MKQSEKYKKRLVLMLLLVITFIGIVWLFYERKQGEENTDILSNIQIQEIQTENEKNVEKKSEITSNKSTEKNNIQEESNNDDLVIVHIIGEVNNPGIVKLKQGERIVDAIEKAGGVTGDADLSKVNLAYVVSDGQKINIPNINNKEENFQYVTSEEGKNVLVEKENCNNNGNSIGKVNAKVNINTASQSELETLTGIGPLLAEKIVNYRKSNGKFKAIEDLKNVGGIGEAKYDAIKNNICVK